MALTETARGTGGNTTGATSIGIVPSGTLPAGSLAVLFIAYDNSGTSGADPYSSISDDAGNTWTSRQGVLRDPGAANAGVAGRIFTSLLGTQLTTGSTITVSFGAFSVPAKAWALFQVDGGTGVPTYKSAGPSGGDVPASNNAPTLTTTSITSGSVLFAAWFREGNAAPSAVDSDTSNGTWSSGWGTGQGSAGSGIEVRGQNKTVTGTATQTFDSTFAAGRDTVGGWVEIEEVGGVSPVTGTGAGAGAAPTASGTGKETFRVVGAGAGAAPTSAGTGKETFRITGAGVGAAATSDGSGTVTVDDSFTGTGAGTQAASTGTGAGLLHFSGTGAGTSAAATSSGLGSETFIASGAGTSATSTGDGAGTALLHIAGTGAGSGVAPTGEGMGIVLVDITGEGAGMQAAPTGSGSGQIPSEGNVTELYETIASGPGFTVVRIHGIVVTTRDPRPVP